MISVLSNHPIFEPFDLDLDSVRPVEIGLGANATFAARLPGVGVPCVLYPRLADGSTLGTGAHAGFVVELAFADLIDIGYPENDIWFALGAREGTHLDPDAADQPVCKDCVLSAEPGTRFEGDDPTDWEPDPDAPDGYRGRFLVARPAGPAEPCWCCVTALRESLDQATAQIEDNRRNRERLS